MSTSASKGAAARTTDGSSGMPAFLVIGGMKCGSTTLHDYLARHPQLADPTHKEPGFFSRPERFAKGMQWYQGLWRNAQPGQLRFESSTCYTRWPHFGPVAPRIYAHLPRVKLVYILRHPVRRAYSHYQHEMLERKKKHSGPIVSFEVALEQSEEFFDSGCYWKQLERFLAYYDRAQLHVLTLDALKSRPDDTLVQLQRFLEIEIVPDLSKRLSGASNKIGDRAARQTRNLEVERLRTNPLVRVAKRLVPPFVRAAVRERVMRSSVMQRRVAARSEAFAASVSELTPATYQLLLDRYAGPNRELAEFLGRELPETWSR